MIRFCDKEVCCVTENDLNRRQLMTFFLNGNRNEPVCILKESGEFAGIVTYESILGNDVENAVRREFVILNHEIWKNGRAYFKRSQKEFGGVKLLPVLDREHRLLCFAYEDMSSNRELRMLDELSDCSGALDFRDVYPEYDCVTIQGFNELAFYFSEYLAARGVLVRTEGELWDAYDTRDLFAQEETALDYRRLVIYGEGVGPREERIELRDSVSAEFECIDRIYEENIRKGVIRETVGSFKDILHLLHGKQICVLGIGDEALNAYDLLLGYGLDICCFIHEATDEQGRMLFCKKILKKTEAMECFSDAVFIETNAKHSVCGTEEQDFYHYLGYKRNERFFLLRDYADIAANGLRNILSHIMKQPQKRLVLLGDPWLCLKLKEILEAEEKEDYGQIVYCDILGEHSQECERLTRIECGQLCMEDTCLLLLPEYYGCNDPLGKTIKGQERERHLERLRKCNIKDFAEYSSESAVFYSTDSDDKNEKGVVLTVAKILIGSIEPGNGNVFFRGILENHPQIFMLPQGYLNSNLFSVCVRLSTEKNTKILPLFWSICNKEEPKFRYSHTWEVSEKEIFNQYMRNMLAGKERFTSQELFVMIHIAYARVLGSMSEDLSEVVIYWEPHHVVRNKVEYYANWLQGAAMRGYIINIVRNAVIRAGTMLRFLRKYHINQRTIPILLSEPTCEKKNFAEWNRITLRFEDMKREPKKYLLSFCDILGISWSDKLLDVRTGYNGVTGFDLTPVYRMNEDCFSEFDRFRLSLAHRTWQKSYGYPYVNSQTFSRRELRDMFSKKFRFEEDIIFQNNEEYIRYLRLRMKWMEEYLWEVRYEEAMEE